MLALRSKFIRRRCGLKSNVAMAYKDKTYLQRTYPPSKALLLLPLERFHFCVQLAPSSRQTRFLAVQQRRFLEICPLGAQQPASVRLALSCLECRLSFLTLPVTQSAGTLSENEFIYCLIIFMFSKKIVLIPALLNFPLLMN